jgi:hypothetical protein
MNIVGNMESCVHRVAHWLKMNYGYPYSFYAGADMLTGFECATCGVIEDIHVSERAR